MEDHKRAPHMIQTVIILALHHRPRASTTTKNANASLFHLNNFWISAFNSFQSQLLHVWCKKNMFQVLGTYVASQGWLDSGCFHSQLQAVTGCCDAESQAAQRTMGSPSQPLGRTWDLDQLTHGNSSTVGWFKHWFLYQAKLVWHQNTSKYTSNMVLRSSSFPWLCLQNLMTKSRPVRPLPLKSSIIVQLPTASNPWVFTLVCRWSLLGISSWILDRWPSWVHQVAQLIGGVSGPHSALHEMPWPSRADRPWLRPMATWADMNQYIWKVTPLIDHEVSLDLRLFTWDQFTLWYVDQWTFATLHRNMPNHELNVADSQDVRAKMAKTSAACYWHQLGRNWIKCSWLVSTPWKHICQSIPVRMEHRTTQQVAIEDLE